MFEGYPPVCHISLEGAVADGTSLFMFLIVADIQVAEETDVYGNLHMLSLHDIRMTASAVQVNAPPVLGEMGLMIKYDIPLRDIHLGFYQPLFVASRLQAVGIGHVRQRPGIIGPHDVPQLTGQGVERAVFMALETGYHFMG